MEGRAKQLSFHPATTAEVRYVPLKDYPGDPPPAMPFMIGRPLSSLVNDESDPVSLLHALLIRLGLFGSRAAEANSQ